METLSKWLTDKLKERGWTQTELADRIGVPRQTVSSWIHTRNRPKYDNIKALARELQVDTRLIYAAMGMGRAPSPIRERAIQQIVDVLETLPDRRLDDAQRLVEAFAATFADEEEESTAPTSEGSRVGA